MLETSEMKNYYVNFPIKHKLVEKSFMKNDTTQNLHHNRKAEQKIVIKKQNKFHDKFKI